MSIDVVDLRSKVENLEEKNAIIKQENKDLKDELKNQKIENKELIKKCDNLKSNEHEFLNLKVQLEKKNNECKYLEIKLEEIFKCNQCDFKAIRKIDLLNHVNFKHECNQQKDNVSQIQIFQKQMLIKDSRIEKLNLKIWDLEKNDIQKKEQTLKIQAQKEEIIEYKELIKFQKAEIDQLQNHGCDKCDFKTKSISTLIMHLKIHHGNTQVKHPMKSVETSFAKTKLFKPNLLTKMTYSKEY